MNDVFIVRSLVLICNAYLEYKRVYTMHNKVSLLLIKSKLSLFNKRELIKEAPRRMSSRKLLHPFLERLEGVDSSELAVPERIIPYMGPLSSYPQAAMFPKSLGYSLIHFPVRSWSLSSKTETVGHHGF